MPAEPSLHTYHREVSSDKRSSLSVIGDQITPRSTVLDLGCGTGALGRYIRNTADVTIDGVTLSEEEAALARPAYRNVLIANLDGADLAQCFPVGGYDFVVCADILEHLARPEQLLKQVRPLLRDQGRLLVSVPNVAYCGLVAELIAGEFRYRPEGLLDETHLRFFTRQSVIRQLHSTGWRTETIHTVTRELWDSEFDPILENLPSRVRNYLFTRPDAFAYQFVITACPDAVSGENVIPEPARQACETRAEFIISLYLREAGGYSQQGLILSRGIIGEEKQTVSFELPAVHDAPVGLRLDPADHEGVMSIYSMRIVGDSGDALWTWDDQPESLSAGLHQQIRFDFPNRADGATTLALTGEDPFFELPIPSGILDNAFRGGYRLEVELSWPMSADYCSVLPTLDALRSQRDAAIAGLSQLRQALGQIAQASADGNNNRTAGTLSKWLRNWWRKW